MGGQPIDLSGGFVPKQPPAAPGGGGGIDLSGGFVSKPLAAAAAPSTPAAQASAAPSAPATTFGERAKGLLHEDLVDHYLQNAPWWDPVAELGNLAAGAGAGVEQTVAGGAKLGRKLLGGTPTAAENWLQREAAKPTHGAMQTVGKTGEAVGEFFTGEELLSMLGRGGAMLSGADKMKQAGQLATMVQKIPMVGKLLRIGMESVKAGGISAAQEAVKTGGDTEAAATAGKVNMALTAALGTAGLPLAAGVRYLADLAPVQRVLEGVPITALKSQINKAGRFIEGGDISDIAPEVAEQQQAAAHQVLRNVASRATGKVMDAINNTRKYFATGEEAAQGALPEGVEPIMFDLESPQSAARSKATSPQQTELGSTAATVPERMLEEGGLGSLGKTVPERMQGTGAVRQTTNPAEAISHLEDLDELRQSRAYSDMSESQRAAIDGIHKRLSDQLAMYHASPYRNNFAPIDVASVVPNVHTFGHAEAQIKASIQPVFDAVNKASGGKMADLEQGVRDAKQMIRDARTPQEFNAANELYEQRTDAVDSMYDQYNSSVTRAEHQTAKQAYGQAKRLGQLHAVFEHMMNGVTHEESADGLSRAMTGNARNLQSWIDKPGNQKMLDDLVGQETRTNLKELTLLMSKVQSNRHAAIAAKNIAKILDNNRYRTSGSTAGSILGGILGHGWGAIPGSLLGGIAGGGMQNVLRIAATNPSVGKMFTYAVTHGVGPEVYAPLIARTIAEPFTKGEQGTAGSEENKPQWATPGQSMAAPQASAKEAP